MCGSRRYGLDPQLRMLGAERSHLGRVELRGEKAEAVRRTSFARLSWAFSSRRIASSTHSSVVSRSSRSPSRCRAGSPAMSEQTALVPDDLRSLVTEAGADAYALAWADAVTDPVSFDSLP